MSLIVVLVVLGALATAVTLFNGVFSMAQGGEYDQLHSHKLMAQRVILQGATVLLIFIALLLQLAE